MKVWLALVLNATRLNSLKHFYYKINTQIQKLSKLTFKNKIVVIKPLVFKNFYEIKKKNNLDNKKLSLLIFGGSQGANIFDTLCSLIIFVISEDGIDS